MKSRLNEIRRARPLLGTFVEIGAAGNHAAAAIDAAFREVATVHRLMSFHEETSDVSRINRASPRDIVQINPRTYEVLSCARMISLLSAGVFDVTVGGTLVDQGVLPRPDGSQSYDKEASFEDVILLRDNLVTVKRRLWIDLGGIAKGYAVDRAIETLKRNGADSGIVNAGGDLFVFGNPQPIHIRHPEDASLVWSSGLITNLAVASSSCNFAHQSEDGKVPDPLIDPKRKTSVRWKQGVTVITTRCMVADALTKVVRLVPRRAPMLLARFNAHAFIINQRGVRALNDRKAKSPGSRSAIARSKRLASNSYFFEKH